LNIKKEKWYIIQSQTAMNIKFCTCAYYKCVERGLRPANHALACPMFKKEYSPYKETWLRECDRIHYNEIRQKINKKNKTNSK